MTTEDPVVDENVTPSAEEGGRSREGKTIRNMAADSDVGAGPNYPSGMNTVEAALSGADENVPEEALAAMRGEALNRGSDEPTPADGTSTSEDPSGL